MKEVILIVDDNNVNRIVMESHLLALNYKCVVLKESTRIIDVANEVKPDVILLDLYMPIQDGYETLELLKSQVGRVSLIPVIMTTAETSKTAIKRCIALGALDYLTKPINFIDLEARIKSALLIVNLTKKVFSLEQKNIFDATTVSANHLINQPLTVAKGSLELLMAFHKGSLTEKQAKLINRSIDAVNDIADILQTMTDTEAPDLISYSGDTAMIDIKKK